MILWKKINSNYLLRLKILNFLSKPDFKGVAQLWYRVLLNCDNRLQYWYIVVYDSLWSCLTLFDSVWLYLTLFDSVGHDQIGPPLSRPCEWFGLSWGSDRSLVPWSNCCCIVKMNNPRVLDRKMSKMFIKLSDTGFTELFYRLHDGVIQNISFHISRKQ